MTDLTFNYRQCTIFQTIVYEFNKQKTSSFYKYVITVYKILKQKCTYMYALK